MTEPTQNSDNVWRQGKEFMTDKKSDVKKFIEVFVDQAKDTLKNVEQYAKIPNADERKRLTNEAVLAGMKTVGVASAEEIDALNSRIDTLEKRLSKLEKPASKQETQATPTP